MHIAITIFENYCCLTFLFELKEKKWKNVNISVFRLDSNYNPLEEEE